MYVKVSGRILDSVSTIWVYRESGSFMLYLHLKMADNFKTMYLSSLEGSCLVKLWQAKTWGSTPPLCETLSQPLTLIFVWFPDLLF